MRGVAVVALHPQEIRRHFLCRDWRRKTTFYGQSLDLPLYRRRGRWDRQTIPFTQHSTYLRLQQIHQYVYLPLSAEQGLGNKATLSRAVELGKHMPHPVSEGILRRKLELLEHMASQGYRQDMSPDYMGLAIARDGSPIKVSEGNNRLAAAQLLGLPQIVAEVRYVHERWYQQQVKSRGDSGPAGIREALAELDSLQDVWPPPK